MHFHWTCSRCGTTFLPEEIRYCCPRCGPTGLLEMAPDYERIAGTWSRAVLAADPRRSIWRYGPLLPLEHSMPSNVGEADVASERPIPGTGRSTLDTVGSTPLTHAARLGESLGLAHLRIKDDGRNPTGSFKDRASAVVIARALELGEPVIATASSGNAAAALAGLCAAAGTRCVIFVPSSAPEAKITQLLIYGATVLLVDGSYDQAFDLCLDACDAFGWYCRNTGYNPHTTEGKKTCAFEIAEQLGWETPDTVLVSVGDGNIITGLHRGFVDLLGLGWIDRIPRLVGVQAAGSPAVYHAWRRGHADVAPDRAETIADSIKVGLPRDGFRALRAIRATGGACVAVDEDAILEAMARVGRTTGIFAEPASAVAFAGLFALVERGVIGANERVVVVNTGNGLKDIRAAMRAVGQPQRIAPDLEAVRAVVYQSAS